MADDTENDGASEAPARKRSRSGSSSRSRKSSGRKTASKRARATVEDEQGKAAEHAAESDRTVPGGVYIKNDGRYVNAHNEELDPDTFEKLDPDAVDEARDARFAELDEQLEEAES